MYVYVVNCAAAYAYIRTYNSVVTNHIRRDLHITMRIVDLSTLRLHKNNRLDVLKHLENLVMTGRCLSSVVSECMGRV